MPFLLL